MATIMVVMSADAPYLRGREIKLSLIAPSYLVEEYKRKLPNTIVIADM